METRLPMNLNSKGNALTTQVKGWVEAGFTLWERLLRALVGIYIGSSQESHVKDYGTIQALPSVKLSSRKSTQNTEFKDSDVSS